LFLQSLAVQLKIVFKVVVTIRSLIKPHLILNSPAKEEDQLAGAKV
jgi:hypothetical protein